MSRVYLDSCCIIYLVEATTPFHAALSARLATHRSDPASRLLTSRLSRLECRTRPLRDRDSALLAAYDAFFLADRLLLVDVSAPVIERATDLRARYRLRTPDALHLATAIQETADVFLTGDAALARCTEIRVDLL